MIWQHRVNIWWTSVQWFQSSRGWKAIDQQFCYVRLALLLLDLTEISTKFSGRSLLIFCFTYTPEGVTAMPRRLHARLCHAFIVDTLLTKVKILFARHFYQNNLINDFNSMLQVHGPFLVNCLAAMSQTRSHLQLSAVILTIADLSCHTLPTYLLTLHFVSFWAHVNEKLYRIGSLTEPVIVEVAVGVDSDTAVATVGNSTARLSPHPVLNTVKLHRESKKTNALDFWS